MTAARELDLVCLGRVAVDIYGEQVGAALEAMQTFAMYLGGCAGNIAVGSARLGLRAAMLSRVGDEQMGRFVRQTLLDEGVDVTRLQTDPHRLTGLVLLGIRDRQTFPLVFYRADCADMALCFDDADAALIGRAQALLVTGTHFSQAEVDAVSRQAMAAARAAGTRVVLDIDYRPVLWGLTGHCMGESRYVASERVSAHLQSILPSCDLVVGTEEEFCIAGGSEVLLDALRQVRACTPALLVVKRGPLGCVLLDGEIPDDLEHGQVERGLPVEVLNVLGAGDAFLSGFLSGWLRGESLAACARRANACGALVVSRHGCAPAMPTRDELDDYLARASSIGRIDRDPRLNYLHRVTTRRGRWPELHLLALDHRAQLEELARRQHAPVERLSQLKSLLMQAARACAAQLAPLPVGLILDDKYGAEALAQWNLGGAWLARPVEQAGQTPLVLEHGPNIGLTLRGWPRHHVVKCLLRYHPDDDKAVRAQHEARLQQVAEACVHTGHELMVQLVPPSGSSVDARTPARSLARLYALGIMPDWWSLPAATEAATWQQVEAVIEAQDPHCRGVLMLGGSLDRTSLQQAYRAASSAACVRGVAVGRTIYNAAATDWLAGRLDDAALIAHVAEAFVRVVELWQQRATLRQDDGV